MDVTVQQGVGIQQPASLLVVGIGENETPDNELAALMEEGDFLGKEKQTALLYPRDTLPPRRVLLVGLGKRENWTPDTLRQAAAHGAAKARDLHVADIAMQFPALADAPAFDAAQAIVEGAELALYRYLDHKTNLTPDDTHTIERMVLWVEQHIEEAQQGAHVGQAVARGVNFARTLANMPGNELVPTRMGEIARELGNYPNMNVTVKNLAELEQEGFGGILAVGKGSACPPCFIIIEYGTPSPDCPTICLVGKGITFDTGGISIKPSANMEEMKRDMGGAATVLGTMQTVGELQPPLHIVALISSAENMPDGNAYKPGDVIKTLSGKTVEVTNTDAEGRIVLADALFYSQRYTPHAVVDIATLTGAIKIALGSHAVGMMGTSEELIERLRRAGEASSERVWQLPLWDAYRELMKSDIADIKNADNSRQAGSITAGIFLSEFVGKAPWAHLDIAGTAWRDSPIHAYETRGATGVGVRLLTRMLRNWDAS
jgi:leucyl aminopeptidase